MKKKLIALLLVLAILVLCGCLAKVLLDTPEEASAPQVTGGEKLTVHFLDVGQADATLILCGDSALLIDGGNQEDAPFVLEYLRQQGVGHLDYILCTHAHEDHVGGLPAVLSVFDAETVYAPVTEYNTKVFRDFVEKTEKEPTFRVGSRCFC